MNHVCTSILTAPDNVSQTGPQIDVNQLVSASFQAIFGDATAAGTVKIQASNAPDKGDPHFQVPSAQWTDIPNATATIASGASALITIANMTYHYIRAVWTNSSGGSATITVNMNGLSA